MQKVYCTKIVTCQLIEVSARLFLENFTAKFKEVKIFHPINIEKTILSQQLNAETSFTSNQNPGTKKREIYIDIRTM